MTLRTKKAVGGLIALLLAGGLFATNGDGASFQNLILTMGQVTQDAFGIKDKPAMNDTSQK